MYIYMVVKQQLTAVVLLHCNILIFDYHPPSFEIIHYYKYIRQ